MKFTATLLAIFATSAVAFQPVSLPKFATRGLKLNAEEEPKLGSGGMADTRDPETKVDEDPRKSISAAPSFEEYMKQRDSGA
ncbi:hypothetical protein TrVE_jg8535 [Triparma verrucosa]|uniref:Uncharacterized protein n=2 Tax=Triparma TaxID=722752 RepID=A0A9W7E4J9_9STRA|nr:hypothetical protein TrST_g14185 [Triparma strigata]GMI11537.1 hypothetical protein TrVE_jg8535 [Triparma verrucosa]